MFQNHRGQTGQHSPLTSFITKACTEREAVGLCHSAARHISVLRVFNDPSALLMPPIRAHHSRNRLFSRHDDVAVKAKPRACCKVASGVL